MLSGLNLLGQTPIHAADDLAEINNDVASLKGSYILMSDLVLEDLTPIGSEKSPFLGTFDGNGHTITIRSFQVDTASTLTIGVGLFGRTGRGSTIKNLRVSGEVKYDSDAQTLYLGAIAGVNAGTIRCCVSTADIHAHGGRYTAARGRGQFALTLLASSSSGRSAYITYQDEASGGGITGLNMGVIENCYATGHVTVSGDGHKNAGGIAGRNGYGDRNTGFIRQCYATGNIMAKDNAASRQAGGISGLGMPGHVTHSVALNEKIETIGTRKGMTVGGIGIGYPSNIAFGVTSVNFESRGKMNNSYYRHDILIYMEKDEEDEKNNKSGKTKKFLYPNRGKDIDYALTQTQNWWTNAKTGVLYPFGMDEKSPWQWNDDLKRPVLYWE